MRALSWFRRLLALHQVVYLFHFVADPQAWFAPGRMVRPVPQPATRPPLVIQFIQKTTMIIP